jgi:ankyrin repeat protein
MDVPGAPSIALPEPDDPVAAFIEAACVARTGHASGTLDAAQSILARFPRVAASTVHTAAILADEAAVRRFLASDPASATAKGGPYAWDALTHLCFSRYLRLDATRAESFVHTARALLDHGASARTGWYERDAGPGSRTMFESAIYGAAGVARHRGLTELLVARGADPNDEETPYHVPETRDNAVLRVLLDSGTLNGVSLTVMLLRKTDWHDHDGLVLLLDHGADPNRMTRFGDTSLHHAVRRDNGLAMIASLLEHGANPALLTTREGRSAAAMAARRGRGDVLALLDRRGAKIEWRGVDRLIAMCAADAGDDVRSFAAGEPALAAELLRDGGTLLAEFAGAGNAAGVRHLLDCGVSPAALYEQGDPYFGIARGSTALHVAAWRGRPMVVQALLGRGAPVNARDGNGRTALALAVKACVDSYWMAWRSPESVRLLLDAGAVLDGVTRPCGYEEVDRLLDSRGG